MLLGLVLGLLLGVIFAVVAKQILPNGDAKRIKELEEEHEKYRQQVDGHFTKTSVLFKGMAEQYREVYKHMAQGAGELCSDEAKASQLDLADLALLSQPDFTNNDDSEAFIEARIEDGVDTVSESTAQTVPQQEMQDNGYELDEDDDMALAGEVEMSPEMVEQFKNKTAKKQ